MASLPSLADAPNTLREYETIYILKPDTVNEKVAEVNERVKGIIESMGGKVLGVDNWGKRKLSYEIRKQLKGIYLYWTYLASADTVAEFERNMRMLDPVIRYMTIKVDKDVDPSAHETELDEEAYVRAATTAADEEELMMRRGGADGEGAEGETAEGETAEGETAEGETAEAKTDSESSEGGSESDDDDAKTTTASSEEEE